MCKTMEMTQKTTSEMLLYDPQGARLYLTNEEVQSFMEQAKQQDRPKMTFCMTLALTGCRISEALNLKVSSIDLIDQTIVFESLKKRQKGIYRAIPVPSSLLVSDQKRS